MLKLGRVTIFKMLFLVLVFVSNFDLFEFLAVILEKGLFLLITEIQLKKFNYKIANEFLFTAL